MAVISFGEGANQVWNGSGWAVRQVLKDLKPYAAGNSAFLSTLARVEVTEYFPVCQLGSPLRESVLAAIQQMCADIIAGTRPSTIEQTLPGDTVAHVVYHKLIRDLLSLAKAAADDNCQDK